MSEYTKKNPAATHTWQVEDIKVTVISQNRAVPLVGQTCNFPVSLKLTLDQWDSSLDEDLNEDISCEDGENTVIAAVSKTVRLPYLGLQTLTQSVKLLVAGVNSLKPQEENGNYVTIADKLRLVQVQINSLINTAFV